MGEKKFMVGPFLCSKYTTLTTTTTSWNLEHGVLRRQQGGCQRSRKRLSRSEFASKHKRPIPNFYVTELGSWIIWTHLLSTDSLLVDAKYRTPCQENIDYLSLLIGNGDIFSGIVASFWRFCCYNSIVSQLCFINRKRRVRVTFIDSGTCSVNLVNMMYSFWCMRDCHRLSVRRRNGLVRDLACGAGSITNPLFREDATTPAGYSTFPWNIMSL